MRGERPDEPDMNRDLERAHEMTYTEGFSKMIIEGGLYPTLS